MTPLAQAIALAIGISASTAQAATISVNSPLDDGAMCTVRNAFESANSDISVGNCTAGSGNDLIDLSGIEDATVTLTNSQLLSKSNITVQGHNVTIDADGESMALFIITGRLTIGEIHFVNGNGSRVLNYGGVIDVNTGYGGCIESQAATLVISNSSISNCSTTSSTESMGGGMLVKSGSAQLFSSSISGNSAGQGGGLFATGADLVLNNATISGNTASGGSYGGFGGGVHLENVTASISGSNIAGNYADNTGGGLTCFSYGVVTITDSSIAHNSAGQKAGGLHNTNCQAQLLDSTITGNSASKGGGVFGPMTITNSQLSANTAELGGGAYFPGPTHLENSRVTGNTASDKGAGVYAYYADLTLSNSIVSGNTVSGISVSNQGAGIFQRRGSLTMLGTTVSLNQAPGSGGGMLVKDAPVNIFGSSILNNYSGGNGGGMFTYSRFTIKDSTLAYNSAENRGGGIFAWRDATSTITNTTISTNYARYGGAGLVVNQSDVSLISSTVAENTSSDTEGEGSASVRISGGGKFSSTNSVLFNPNDQSDCEISTGSAEAEGVNFIADQDNCSLPVASIVSGDPNLGGLADNGGPTLTHLPLAGSPLINAGDTAEVPPDLNRDQRGLLYLRIRGGIVDLGAVETGGPLPQVLFEDGFEGQDPEAPSGFKLFRR